MASGDRGTVLRTADRRSAEERFRALGFPKPPRLHHVPVRHVVGGLSSSPTYHVWASAMLISPGDAAAEVGFEDRDDLQLFAGVVGHLTAITATRRMPSKGRTTPPLRAIANAISIAYVRWSVLVSAAI
jgi:hypothetical protein